MVTSFLSRGPREPAGPPPSGLAMLPFVLGLTVGLVVAAAVALYVTRAPVPFVDRGIQRSSPATQAADLPSQTSPASGGLDARDEEKEQPRAKPAAPASTATPRGGSATPATSPAGSGVAASSGAAGAKATAGPASSAGAAAPASSAAAANQFFLQVAAFKSFEEADQMRARLAFMGYEAQIFETKKDSLVFYRVRLGPYRSFEELNRAKTSLSDNGLESTVVRSSQ